jgi:hypothetical protein
MSNAGAVRATGALLSDARRLPGLSVVPVDAGLAPPGANQVGAGTIDAVGLGLLM